nr:hypothetical protein [Bacilli bacterium]
MERYTFEDLTNERIREYNELDARAKKLENLITVVNDEYKMGIVKPDDFDDRKLLIYYDYTDEMKNLMYKIKITKLSEPFRYILPANRIEIKSEEDIKSEYNDLKGNTALVIEDVDKFKEAYNAFFDNETYKHIDSMDEKWLENYNAIIDAKDKIRLRMNGSFLTFIHDGKDVSFQLCDNRFVTLAASSRTAEENIDLFTRSIFNAEYFDEYVRKNIDSYEGKNKTFAFDDKYRQKHYHPVGFRCYAMEEQFEISENDKKIILTKVPRG